MYLLILFIPNARKCKNMTITCVEYLNANFKLEPADTTTTQHQLKMGYYSLRIVYTCVLGQSRNTR